MDITIEPARSAHAQEIAALVGELLNEIMTATGTPAFNFDLDDTGRRLAGFIDGGHYRVFVARENGRALGFVALYESYALYAEGKFGTIPEFYVRPDCRSRGVGRRLMDAAKAFGAAQGWKRLEVTTPPLPHFDRTLRFYEREGFAISGGRKLKTAL